MNSEKCEVIRDLIADVLNDGNNKELLGGIYVVRSTDTGLAITDDKSEHTITITQTWAAAESDNETRYILGEKLDDALIAKHHLVRVDDKYLYDSDLTHLFMVHDIRITNAIELQKFNWDESSGCIEGSEFDRTRPIMDYYLKQDGNIFVCKGYCRKTDAGDDMFIDLENALLVGKCEA